MIPPGVFQRNQEKIILPQHIENRWRIANQLIDLSLAANLPPSPVVEAICAAIAGEWSL